MPKLACTLLATALPLRKRPEVSTGTVGRKLVEDETTDSSSNCRTDNPKQHRSEPR
jgi:hypothetical protein